MRGVAQGEAKNLMNFKRTLTELGILRDLLEQRLHEEDTPINPVQVNNALSEISKALNLWIGGAKYLTTEESTHG